ncbi:MAG TPA: hypothetical protein VKS22_08010 [Candidatus Binataceae bacterium]|nr:hypothetical protein [Candidatus Binataceae bacterium]
MSKRESQVAQELGKFVQAFWLELPMAAARNLLGDGDALSAAGWKAYDAWISLTNEATNQVYESPAMGSLAGRAMETSLRMQQAGSAMASAFFGNLWPAVGLPTRDEVAALRGEIAELRQEIAAPEPETVHEADNEEPPYHRFAAKPGDGLKVVRGATVDHVKVNHHKPASDEDAAA